MFLKILQISGLQACNIIKNKLQHRCFLWIFQEHLQTTASVFFLKPTIVNINIKTTLFQKTDLKNKLIINQHFQELVVIATNWKRLLCMRYNGSSSQTRVTTISPVQTVWWKKFSISMICVNDIYQSYMIWSVICVCLTCEIKTTT